MHAAAHAHLRLGHLLVPLRALADARVARDVAVVDPWLVEMLPTARLEAVSRVATPAREVHLRWLACTRYPHLDVAAALQRKLVGKLLVQGAVVAVRLMGEVNLFHVQHVVGAHEVVGSARMRVVLSECDGVVERERHVLRLSAVQPSLPLLHEVEAMIGGARARQRKRELDFSETSLEAPLRRLMQLVRVASHPSGLLRDLGAPKAVLIHGPPGAGKSELARKLAAQLGVDLVSGRSVVDEIGVYAARGQVLVIDDLDQLLASAVDGDADDADGGQLILGSSAASATTAVQALALAIDSTLVVGVVRDVENVPAPLLRAGRFDHHVLVPAPNAAQRQRLLEEMVDAHELRPLLEDGVLAEIAHETPGFLPRDLEKLLQAALLAATVRQGADVRVSIGDLRAARAKSQVSGTRVETGSWEHVHGYEREVRALRQVVRQWADPSRGARLGLGPPAGVLLYGPPGCGKTLALRAIASEPGLNFVRVAASDIFSKYLGDSEKAIRRVFREARELQPCVVAFDEIDAVGSSRGGGFAGTADSGGGVEGRVLSALLNEMDGVEGLDGVYVVGATNRREALDSALVRPGRLDCHIEFPLPRPADRAAVLHARLSQMPLQGVDDAEVQRVVEWTDGCSVAQLQRVCDGAGLAALREDADAQVVTWSHLKASALRETGVVEDMQPTVELQLQEPPQASDGAFKFEFAGFNVGSG